MSAELETYLRQLEHELRRRGLASSRIVEEARGHLIDAIEEGVRRGLPPDSAAQEAMARFGAPRTVARHFAVERHRRRDRLLLATAVVVGVAIAYVDSRPRWDDAGITALSMAMAAGVLGAIGPERPWLWALGVGIWIPLHALVRTGSPSGLGMFAVLAFPAAGAYSGMALRRMLEASSQLRATAVLGQHDRARQFGPNPLRFGLHQRSKVQQHAAPRPISEPEARAQVMGFLERATRDSDALGASGAIQSLTLLDDAASPGQQVRTYRALFENGVTATAVHTSDRWSISVEALPD